MIKTGSLLQLTVVLGLALSAGGCSTLADLDPTGLLGGDSATPDSQFPDAAAPAPSDANAGTTPDLASLPARPATTTPAQQQQTAQSLAADGAQVQYSADALRGGTEAAAPAPGAAGPVIAAAPPPALPQANNDAPPTAQAAPAAQASNPDQPPSASAPGAQSAVPARVAMAAPPAASTAASGGEPAVPANARGSMAMMSSSAMSDADLGFKPSAAPPLDPSINQWVAAPIVARYRQTASNAGISASSGAAAVPVRGAPDVNGAVMANIGGAPTAVVYFPGDGITLSAAARGEIRSAVQAFKATGGAGTVRVIGHASSRTANMSVEKHMETIFDKSQKRANAVAQELIHEGVPAAKVLVEAVGDSQPVFYESMPKGEDGNRRAEIFVQG